MSIRGAGRTLLGDRWVVGASLAALAWLASYALATALLRGELARTLLSDVAYVVPIAAAVALAWVASFRTQGRQRLFWRLLAIANTSWLAGELTWAVIELGLGRDVPTPSLADVFYLGWYAVALPAVLLAYWPAVRVRGWRALLDASGVTAAIVVAGWFWLIEPQLEYGASLATAVGIAYPLLDIVSMTLLVFVFYASRGRVSAPIALIALGYGVAALADGAYTHVSITGAYDPGSWLDLGWQVEALLHVIAAVAVIRGFGSDAPAALRVERYRGIPFVLGGGAIVCALLGADFFGEMTRPVEVLTVAAVVAVVLRLVLTSREHGDAARHLDTLLAEQTELNAALARRGRTLDAQARVLEQALCEHERTERELEGSVAALHATLDATADAILVVDADRRIVGMNAHFQTLWGIPADVLGTGRDEQALAHALRQLRNPDEFIAKVEELYDAPDAESFDVLEFQDGRIVERYSRPQQLAGRPRGRVWSFRDVTERARLEGELRQAQKLEAVGRLAGGIAHDFNNLLTAIGGYAELLLEEVDAPGPRRSLEEIRSASERAARLTGQLLAFSRKQVLQPTVVDLDEVVTGLRALLAPLLGETIRLSTLGRGGATNVLVDRGQLDQVIVNLVINARDAMPAGGRIAVETERAGDEIVLRVRDTGHGMDEATLANAFDPFFTTKAPGAGTGLGLATVLGIVEQSGGRIGVESRPGAGTTFEIVLPAVAAEPSDEPGPAAPGLPAASRGTVLLAEDETVVRTLLGRVLATAGFDVLVAEDGEAALERAAAHDGPIDVLLTDIVMPGMSGRELAERLVAARPGTPVVYMSGYTDDPAVDRSGAGFLQKPFSPADVVGALNALVRTPA